MTAHLTPEAFDAFATDWMCFGPRRIDNADVVALIATVRHWRKVADERQEALDWWADTAGVFDPTPRPGIVPCGDDTAA